MKTFTPRRSNKNAENPNTPTDKTDKTPSSDSFVSFVSDPLGVIRKKNNEKERSVSMRLQTVVLENTPLPPLTKLTEPFPHIANIAHGVAIMALLARSLVKVSPTPHAAAFWLEVEEALRLESEAIRTRRRIPDEQSIYTKLPLISIKYLISSGKFEGANVAQIREYIALAEGGDAEASKALVSYVHSLEMRDFYEVN